MSSDKLRLKLRVKRLQTMYSQLGRDPNAKEYEIKSLTMDFDKVMRKQLARLKKGRYQRLRTRQHILLTYGLRSRERITIDEEVNSMMKVFEADQKRLKSILQTYEEKKTDLLEREKKERLEVIQMAKDCFSLFKLEYNDQTNKFEKGQVYNLDASMNMNALDMTNTSRIDSATNLSRANLNKNMHSYPHDNEKNETVSAFMMDDARDIRLKHESQHDFDTVLNNIVKKLERIEKEFVLGDFDGVSKTILKQYFIGRSNIRFVQLEI
eukprot:403360085